MGASLACISHGARYIGWPNQKMILQQRLTLIPEAQPMLTDCNTSPLGFESLGSRKVTASFDGGAITSNAGALLLRQTDRVIGLSRQAAACFRDARSQEDIEHTLETLVAQRVHGIALGYEDLNDHDTLRRDPVLGLISGKLEPAAPIAPCSRASPR